MVTAPVGVRCPDCARVGRPAILDTSSSELGRSILFGVGAGVLGALFLSLVILAIEAIGLGIMGVIVGAVGFVGIGYLVGEAVRYGSGRKMDRRLKYVGATGVFSAWVAAVLFSQLFGFPIVFVGHIIVIAGLIVSFYVASSRLRT